MFFDRKRNFFLKSLFCFLQLMLFSLPVRGGGADLLSPCSVCFFIFYQTFLSVFLATVCIFLLHLNWQFFKTRIALYV